MGFLKYLFLSSLEPDQTHTTRLTEEAHHPVLTYICLSRIERVHKHQKHHEIRMFAGIVAFSKEYIANKLRLKKNIISN